MAHFAERFGFDLADALAGDFEADADLFEGFWLAVEEAKAFDEDGALDRFETFASLNGARFYGLPVNEETVTLERTEVAVPDEIAGLVPFHAGERLRWKFVG